MMMTKTTTTMMTTTMSITTMMMTTTAITIITITTTTRVKPRNTASELSSITVAKHSIWGVSTSLWRDAGRRA